MQSFGDDTLLACISIEKKLGILQERNEVPQEENDSDLGKYFKQSLLLSEFMNKDDDVDKSKVSHFAQSTKGRVEENKSAKYFEDVHSKPDDAKNFPSTSSISKGNKILSSQREQNSHKTKNENNMIYLKEKHLNIINNVKNCNKSSARNLHKNKSNNNLQVARNDNSIGLSFPSSTYDKENSNVILSRPLCTQDRYKLASWGLPPNILQVLLYFN